MKKIETIKDLEGFTGLVLFTAPWCMPCRTYKPSLEKFAKEYGIKLGIVDTDVAPALAGTYGVRSVPTTFLFVNGSPSRSKSGVQTEAALGALVQ